MTAHKKVREKQKESSVSEKEEKERSISENNQRLLLIGIAVWPSEPASKGVPHKNVIYCMIPNITREFKVTEKKWFVLNCDSSCESGRAPLKVEVNVLIVNTWSASVQFD